METAPDRPERRIRVLPDRLANMIAAGEVVERPSAVVKELVENALDAGATAVIMELAGGGRRLVRVSDDGTGMNADDAVLAFERHATSKIATPEDLGAILTYGFRGEALPSIAAVSRTSLQSCPDASGVGTEVIIEGGQLRAVREVGRTRGTTVTVHDLFYNTPARRKFLRTDATELRQATRELIGLALGAPKLAFRLSHGGRELFECRPVATWQERVQSLFGREILLRGVPVDREGPVMRLRGLLGRRGEAGGGFSEQYLLVNGRSVQSRILRKAIMDGYEATIEGGRLPFFVLFLDVDPTAVDVNVHPQKREVRFEDEGRVYRFVADAVRAAFADVGLHEPQALPESLPIESLPIEPQSAEATPRPDEAASPDRAERPSGVPHFWRGGERALASRVAEGDQVGYQPAAQATRPQRPARDARARKDDAASQLTLHLVSPEDAGAESPDRSEPDIASADSHLWQFQQKYIFVSTRDGLWIIDQHVAHERILYEEAMAAFAGEPPASQRLLFPLTLELTPEENALLDEVQSMLEAMGFGIQRLGGHSIMVDAYPASVETWADGQLLRRMISEVAEAGPKRTGIKEHLAISYSCHAATKAGDPLTPRKMRWLIERLFSTSMPYICPHGRPVIVRIATEELDHRFGRASQDAAAPTE